MSVPRFSTIAEIEPFVASDGAKMIYVRTSSVNVECKIFDSSSLP